MFDKLKALIQKRREKKAAKLLLQPSFWVALHEFAASLVVACADRELSREEVELLIEKWRDVIQVARNAKEMPLVNS